MISKHRNRLPQLDGSLFLTDGGLETTLIFHEGFELPHFASFPLLRERLGRQAIRRYYERYIAIAAAAGRGFILEGPTWRCSPDWGVKLGYSPAQLSAVNQDSIRLMMEIRDALESSRTPIVISGCIGPRGDGYDPGLMMSAEEAGAYHAPQVRDFAAAGADMAAAFTMTNSNEAIGIARAASEAGLPVAISFTLETDGRLPTGQGLLEAIAEVDAATARAPAYYMINCAHPTHFDHVFRSGSEIVARVRGLRANSSRRSHQELNDSPDLDAGNPAELGQQYRDLLARHPHINVIGGCCGTDHRHVEQMSLACATQSHPVSSFL